MSQCIFIGTVSITKILKALHGEFAPGFPTKTTFQAERDFLAIVDRVCRVPR